MYDAVNLQRGHPPRALLWIVSLHRLKALVPLCVPQADYTCTNNRQFHALLRTTATLRTVARLDKALLLPITMIGIVQCSILN